MTVVPEAPEKSPRSFTLFGIAIPAIALTLSKDRTYFGLRRNRFLLLLLCIALALLALVLGLAIGLTLKKKSSKPYAPPTSTTRQHGDATYYAPGLGACGIDSSEEDAIVAISWIVYDAAAISGNPNENPLCGRKVWATRVREDTGEIVSVVATVVDRCTGCKAEDLDFSPALFGKLAEVGLGRVNVEWAWI